jgi:hypothetical protein
MARSRHGWQTRSKAAREGTNSDKVRWEGSAAPHPIHKVETTRAVTWRLESRWEVLARHVGADTINSDTDAIQTTCTNRQRPSAHEWQALWDVRSPHHQWGGQCTPNWWWISPLELTTSGWNQSHRDTET